MTKEEKILATAEKEKLILQKKASLPEFKPWPKIARLNRDIVITEKIDGTNAAVCIVEVPPENDGGTGYYQVSAQSRTQVIFPENDNFGFANWVKQHEQTLIETLGVGIHFGEWMGVGIQRGYGLSERRFYLFNTHKWAEEPALASARTKGCAIYCVPVLYEGPWSSRQEMFCGMSSQLEDVFHPQIWLNVLRAQGSYAILKWKPAEGIVVLHKASGQMFKATCVNDGKYKGEV